MDDAVRTSPRPIRLHQGPLMGRILAACACGGLSAWLGLKILLPSPSGWIELAAGISAIVGILAAGFLFVGTYGYLANAPDTLLDEREVRDRDRAHRFAFKALALLSLLAWLASELLVKSGGPSDWAVMRNYLQVVFLLALILPAAYLAFSQSVLPED